MIDWMSGIEHHADMRSLFLKSLPALFALVAFLSLGGCASAPAGTEPARGISGDSETGQDRLWEIHSRTMRELAY